MPSQALAAGTLRSGQRAQQEKPQNFSKPTTNLSKFSDPIPHRPKTPIVSGIRMPVDGKGFPLLFSDKAYADNSGAKAAQQAAQKHAPSRPAPSGLPREIQQHIETPAQPADRSSYDRKPNAHRTFAPAHIINEGASLPSPPPARPRKHSFGSKMREAILGPESEYIDNGKDDWADRRLAKEQQRRNRSNTPQQKPASPAPSLKRRNSIESAASSIKSAFKKMLDPDYEEKQSSAYKTYMAEVSDEGLPRAGRYDMERDDWYWYDKKVEAMKKKISLPIQTDPVFDTDHIQRTRNAGPKSFNRPAPLPPKKDQRNGKSHSRKESHGKPGKASSDSSIQPTPTSAKVFIDESGKHHTQFAQFISAEKQGGSNQHREPAIPRKVAVPKPQPKHVIDRKLGKIPRKSRDSDMSWVCKGLPDLEPPTPKERLCPSCGRPMTSLMDPGFEFCNRCATKTHRAKASQSTQRKAVPTYDTRPTNKEEAKLRPVSAVEPGYEFGPMRPATALYDDTDITTLIPPDTITQRPSIDEVMKQQYPDHPALKTPPNAAKHRVGNVVRQQPNLTKSFFAQDAGNPYNDSPPVPKLSKNGSTVIASMVNKPSPLDRLTEENLRRLAGGDEPPRLPTVPIGSPISGFDAQSDVTRDTRFYDFYDDVFSQAAKTGRSVKNSRKGR